MSNQRTFATLLPSILLLILPNAASAARDCQGPLDSKYLFYGSQAGMSWWAGAFQPSQSYYCFERRLLVVANPPKQWINWPLGGIKNQLIVGPAINNHCCSVFAEPKSGPLEYGPLGNSFLTKVAVDKEEFVPIKDAQNPFPFNETWASTTTRLFVDSAFVNLSVIIGSRYNSFGTTSEYVYFAQNIADNVYIDFGGFKSEFVQQLLKERKMPSLVFLKTGTSLSIAGKLINSPPVLLSASFSVRGEKNEKPLTVLRFNALVPK